MALGGLCHLFRISSKHMKSSAECLNVSVIRALNLQPKRTNCTLCCLSSANIKSKSNDSRCRNGNIQTLKRQQFTTSKRSVHSSASRKFISGKNDGSEMDKEQTSPDKIPIKDKGSTDFRDMLHTLVTKSIESEDVGEVGDEDEDIFVSQSGRVLLFPWRSWNDGPDSPTVGVDGGIPEKVTKTKLPSVTAILQKTMSPESALALLRWENFMIKKLGWPAFQELKQEMFSEGRELHTNIGHALHSKLEEVVIGEGIEGYWESIKDRLPELTSDEDAPVLECHTTHPFLGYHGYADCVTLYQGEPCVVEFKTSRKPKETLSKCFDNPLQLAAYLGSLNFDPSYQFKIEKALLVIAYRDGSPASVHVMDSAVCDVYWKKWLRRLQEYREMGRRNGSKAAEN